MFLISFAVIGGIYLLVFVLCFFPGVLTPDSIDQVTQTVTNEYSNHHPVFHTFTIKLFISIGTKIFGDINAGIAFYSIFSIIFMACAFSLAAETLNEMNFPIWVTIVFVVFFAFMPYHIIYSFTMWKDVIFAGFSVYFTVFLFRYIENLKHRKLSFAITVIAGFGICLFRSNGLFIFVFSAIIFLIVFKSTYKKINLSLLVVIVLSLIIKYPVMGAADIKQPDITEAMSIPIQQVSRDIKDNDDFSDDEKDLINNVTYYDKVSKEYLPYISDPEKKLIRSKNNQKYFKEHVGEFAKFYLTRLAEHPDTYVKAWVDQTKGYYNSGYDYWRWADSVNDNNLGIRQSALSGQIRNLFLKYASLFTKLSGLRIFVSIGFAN